MPRTSGATKPAMTPKLWKSGMALKNRSLSVRSREASICRRLASRLRCVSSTPLGTPSEPLVNRMTAVSSGQLSSAFERPWLRERWRVTKERSRAVYPADAGDLGANVVEVEQFDAGIQEGLGLNLGFLKEKARRDDVSDAGQRAALEHDGRAGGEVEDRRGMTGGPEAQECDRRGVDIREGGPGSRGVGAEQRAPSVGEQFDTDEQLPIRQGLGGGIAQDDEAGATPAGFEHGVEHMRRAVGRFDFELLTDHLIPEPGRQYQRASEVLTSPGCGGVIKSLK